MMVRGKIASYYWVIFLRGLAAVGGVLLLVIPGIIFAVWFCLANYAFVFEGTTGVKALSASKELVKGYWWPVFSRLLVLLIIAMAISSISKVGFFINSLLAMPFGIVYMYVIYEDLKNKKATPIRQSEEKMASE